MRAENRTQMLMEENARLKSHQEYLMARSEILEKVKVAFEAGEYHEVERLLKEIPYYMAAA